MPNQSDNLTFHARQLADLAVMKRFQSEAYRDAPVPEANFTPCTVRIALRVSVADQLVPLMDPNHRYRRDDDSTEQRRIARAAARFGKDGYYFFLLADVWADQSARYELARLELLYVCDAMMRRAKTYGGGSEGTSPRTYTDYLMRIGRVAEGSRIFATDSDGSRRRLLTDLTGAMWLKIWPSVITVRLRNADVTTGDAIEGIIFAYAKDALGDAFRELDRARDKETPIPSVSDDDDRSINIEATTPESRDPEQALIVKELRQRMMTAVLEVHRRSKQNPLGLLIYLIGLDRDLAWSDLIARGGGVNQRTLDTLHALPAHRELIPISLLGLGIDGELAADYAHYLNDALDALPPGGLTDGQMRKFKRDFIPILQEAGTWVMGAERVKEYVS